MMSKTKYRVSLDVSLEVFDVEAETRLEAINQVMDSFFPDQSDPDIHDISGTDSFPSAGLLLNLGTAEAWEDTGALLAESS
jgi:hypothetical protein